MTKKLCCAIADNFLFEKLLGLQVIFLSAAIVKIELVWPPSTLQSPDQTWPDFNSVFSDDVKKKQTNKIVDLSL